MSEGARPWVFKFWAGVLAATGLAVLIELTAPLWSGSIGLEGVVFLLLAIPFAVAVAAALRRPGPRARLEAWTPRLLLLLVSSCVAFLLLEGVVRVVSPPSPYHPLIPSRPHVRLELHPDLRGITPPTRFTTNSWGFRGDEPPADWEGTYTILTIGGSTTECYYLDDTKTWPYLLQGVLSEAANPVWVGNAGFAGHSTRAHLILMREVVPALEPDAVLLLVGINDLWISLDPTREQTYDVFDAYAAGDPVRRVAMFAFHQLRTVQLAVLWKRVLFDDVKVMQETGHGTFVPKPLGPDRLDLGKDPGELLPRIHEYRENLRLLIRTAKQHQTRVVFLTQPLLFGPEPRWRDVESHFYWHERKDLPKLSAADSWRLLSIHNDLLKRVCSEEGAECFDLASKVPHHEEYFYDAAHFTEEGAKLVAQEVGRYLRERGDLDKP